MIIPTEPIGSLPRPVSLIEALKTTDVDDPRLEPLYREAVRDTVERLEATGSPVITDGGQRRYGNFGAYSVHGLPNLAADGFPRPVESQPRWPRLTAGPFRYQRYADAFLDVARRHARVPLKQAVVSPSALSLLYPANGLPGYSREQFIDDVLREHETEVRRCLAKGAHKVQVDFTEAPLAMRIDPSGNLLRNFVDLNNRVLTRFTAEERQRIGVHACPRVEGDSTPHGAVDYAEMLPALFELKAGNFYIALAGEKDPAHVLKVIAKYLKADQRAFVGVVVPLDPRVETPAQVCDRILQAAEYIPVRQLGTTDDSGFSSDDETLLSREKAFAKIRARVEGTAVAGEIIGSG